MIRDGHGGRFRVLAVVEGRAIELGSVRTSEEAEAAEKQARAIEAAGPECLAMFADRWVEEFPRQNPRSNTQMAYMIRPFARAWANRNRNAARYARTLYEDAISIGLAERNPFQGVRLAYRHGQVRVPSEQEVAALIAHLDSPYSEAVGFAAYTGLRKGELLGLRGTDVREDGHLLRVERQLAADGAVCDLKNHHYREAAVLPQARPYLPDTRADVRLFPLNRPMLSYHWRRARHAVGVDEYVFHSLRHFHASWLLDLGATPVDIALQLGHRDGGRLVQELYGHPNDAIARERLRRVATDQHDHRTD